MHFPKPVQFSVECQVLQNSQSRYQKSKNHHEPGKTPPLSQSAKRLCRQEEKNQHTQQQLQFNARGKRRSGEPEHQLHHHHERERRQRKQKSRRRNFFFFFGEQKNECPENEQKSRSRFQDAPRPWFHSALAQYRKCHHCKYPGAKKPHGFAEASFVWVEVAGTKATSSIHAAPCISLPDLSLIQRFMQMEPKCAPAGAVHAS